MSVGFSIFPALLFLAVLPLNHSNAIRLTALFTLGAIALSNAVRNGFPLFPVKLPITLWAAFALLSTLWSANPAFSLSEFKAEVIYGLIALWGFFVLTRDRATLDAFLGALFIGVLVTLIISALQIWQRGGWVGYEWDWQHGFVSYSTYLATVFPLLLFALVRNWNQKWAKPFLLLSLPLFLFIGYTTLNRMFWLTLIVSGITVFAWIWKQARQSGHTRRLAIAATVGIGIASVLFIMVTSQRAVDPLQKHAQVTSTLSHLGNTFAQSERYQLWGFWVDRIQERPWLGVGFGRDLPQKVYEKPPEWFGLMFAHAHNLFLDYALQLGIPGAVVLAFLFISLGYRFWLISRSTDPDRALAGMVGIAVLLAVIFKNMTDDLFWRTDALLFWALMGILLGYGLRDAGRKTP